MDPEILSILGYPGQSRVVPSGIQSHGSQDTKYTGIPRTVPGSSARVVPSFNQGEHSHSAILCIPRYSGCSRVVPGISQGEYSHLVSWETWDVPELSQSDIENTQNTLALILLLEIFCEAHHQRQIPSRQDMKIYYCSI